MLTLPFFPLYIKLNLRLEGQGDDSSKKLKILQFTFFENLLLQLTRKFDLSDLEYLLNELNKSEEEISTDAFTERAEANRRAAEVKMSSPQQLLRSYTVQQREGAEFEFSSNPMSGGNDGLVVATEGGMMSSVPSVIPSDCATGSRRGKGAGGADSDDEEETL